MTLNSNPTVEVEQDLTLPAMEVQVRRFSGDIRVPFVVSEATVLALGLHLKSFTPDSGPRHASVYGYVSGDPVVAYREVTGTPVLTIDWQSSQSSGTNVTIHGIDRATLLRALLSDSLIAAADRLAEAAMEQFTTTESADRLYTALTLYLAARAAEVQDDA